MKTATRKLRPLTKWHGGKSYLARRIVALLPDHRVYTEACAGGLSVFLNKPRSDREVVGDLHPGLMNLYRCMRGDTGTFRRRLRAIPYSQTSFDAALADLGSPDVEARAAAFLVRNRMSRGGLGKTFAWSDRLRGGLPGDVNGWRTILESLDDLCERLNHVELLQQPACLTIADHDGTDALHYVDPPYLSSTRTAKDAYDHEMTEADHRELLDTLKACKGSAFLSGYRSQLYDEALEGWQRVEWEMPNHSGQGNAKQRRVECLWSNRPMGTRIMTAATRPAKEQHR